MDDTAIILSDNSNIKRQLCDIKQFVNVRRERAEEMVKRAEETEPGLHLPGVGAPEWENATKMRREILHIDVICNGS